MVHYQQYEDSKAVLVNIVELDAYHGKGTLLVLPQSAGQLTHVPRLPRAAWIEPSLCCYGNLKGDIDFTSDEDLHKWKINPHRPHFVLNRRVEDFCSRQFFGSAAPSQRSGDPWPYTTSLIFHGESSSELGDLDSQGAPGSTVVNIVDMPYWNLASVPRSRNVTGYCRPHILKDTYVSTTHKNWVRPRMRTALVPYTPKTNLGLPFMFRDLAGLREDPWMRSLIDVHYEVLLNSDPKTTRVAESTTDEWIKLLYTLRQTIAALHGLPQVAHVLGWVSLDYQAVALPCDIDVRQWRKERLTEKAVDAVVESFQALIGDLDLRLALALSHSMDHLSIRIHLERSGLKPSWVDWLEARVQQFYPGNRAGVYLDLRNPEHRSVPDIYMKAVLYAQLPVLIDWPPLQEIVELWSDKTSFVDGSKIVKEPFCSTLQQLYPDQAELERAVLLFHQVVDVGQHIGLIMQPDLRYWSSEEALSTHYRFTWRHYHNPTTEHVVISEIEVPTYLWAEEHGGWLSRRPVAVESKRQVLNSYEPHQIIITLDDDQSPEAIDVYGAILPAHEPARLPRRPVRYLDASIHLDGEDKWPRAWSPLPPESTAIMADLYETGIRGDASPIDYADRLQWDGRARIGPSKARRDAEEERRRWYDQDYPSRIAQPADEDVSDEDDYDSTSIAFGIGSDAPALSAPFDRRWHAGIYLPSRGSLLGRLIHKDPLHDVVRYFGFVPSDNNSETAEADKHRLANTYGIHSSRHDTINWQRINVSQLQEYTNILSQNNMTAVQMGDWQSLKMPRSDITISRDMVMYPGEVDERMSTTQVQPAETRLGFVVSIGTDTRFAILLHQAVLVAQCLRWLGDWHAEESPEMAIQFLVEQLASRGMPYYTVIHDNVRVELTKPARIADVLSRRCVDVTLGERIAEQRFDYEDFMAWEAQVYYLLGVPRVARAALSKGGFIWRIAHEYGRADLIEMAKRGPSRSRVRFANSSVFDGSFIGDTLSLAEERLLTGTYTLVTGTLFLLASVTTLIIE